jgi:hypothetical protein
VYGAWLSLLFDNGFDESIQNLDHVVQHVRGPTSSMTNYFLTSLFVVMNMASGMMSVSWSNL